MIKSSLLVFLLAILATIAQAKSPPNIVLILTDDQGWNSTSLPYDPEIPESGSDFYETPNLDRLMQSGLRFTQAYSPAAVCSPTRHSIQFGMTPAKLGVTSN
ncbi:MAG: sulfatase-like hydrolase/transferase, partial [Planctomycetota bacterium]